MKYRYRAVVCDICGKDMTNDNHQYKFKHRRTFDICADEVGLSSTKKWKKLDMCKNCYRDLESFIAGNNQLRKDGQSPVVVN